MAEGPVSFSALLHETGGVQVLKISGELDLYSVPRFREALEKAVAAVEQAEGPPVLVVDLSGTGFMDSMGLGALLGGTREFRASGGEVRLVVLGGEVRRLLEVTGLLDELRIYPDAPSAARDRRG